MYSGKDIGRVQEKKSVIVEGNILARMKTTTEFVFLASGKVLRYRIQVRAK